ncbi:alpha/beta hydrolase family protein [Aliikangiella coralliicola]|uniref:S9 family peptidase n=1 Tax=Aliikangiella coralliicola TaxID=2592383 RepID=A0A545UC83_9GAMM|nr:S9 family peptidase [Aliikangiella coralliicola]TQV87078.1 S9 family peptidase [Aliikangiella coralliicola]
MSKSLRNFGSFLAKGCVFLFVVSSSFFAHSKPTLEDYAAQTSVSLMRLSPNGERVAFIKNSIDKNAIVVFSLLDNKIISGAQLGDLKPRELYFISDQEIIFVASKVQRVLGIRGELDLSTAFVINTQSGKIRQLLTPGDVIYRGQSGLGDIAGITPDKKYALMPAYVGVTNNFQSSRLALVKASLTSRKSPKILDKGTTSTIDYFINSDGVVVAEERFDNDKNLHQIFSKVGDKKVKIYRNETTIREIAPVGLTPDQKALVIRAGDEDTDRKVLYTMSLKDGKISGPIFSRDDADIESIIFDGIFRIVKGVRYSGFTPSYEFFDKKLQARVSKILAGFSGESVILSDWSADFNDIIFSVSGSSSSGTYYLSSSDKAHKFLANLRPKIKARDINPIVQFSYKAQDGLNIPALLTVPAEESNTLSHLPTIMLPHGGPESYDRVRFDWLAQALASRGYLVIQPQFRGSSGFGLSHIKAGHGEWGKKMQSDLSDGIKFLVKEGITDPNRVCIVGWSYGGYAALAGATLTPELYQCAVSINGISDLELMMKKERAEHGRKHWVFSYWNSLITGNEKGDEAVLAKSSPINFVAKVIAPIMLIHGSRDRVVDIEQSERMLEELTELKKPVVFRQFEGEDHALSSSETRIDVLKMLINFLDQHIKTKQKN